MKIKEKSCIWGICQPQLAKLSAWKQKKMGLILGGGTCIKQTFPDVTTFKSAAAMGT